MAREDRFKKEEPKDTLDKVTICMRRVAKVVKGGRTMRQSALVVVGDRMGKVGLGMGKAAEATDAIEKATADAKRNMFDVNFDGRTIPHEILGVFGRGNVLLMPAPEGTGVIAGGPVRAVLELAGVRDIRTKSLGSNNPINCAKATIEGLMQLRTPEQSAKIRGISVKAVLSDKVIEESEDKE